MCLATKAVHIELATDLLSETFLNVLRRFISRRGRPSDIFPDNGTNFVGTDHDLHDLFSMFRNEREITEIVNYCTTEQITWHFIPPHAPHFGGIWEAAVKCAKTSLRHVAGNTTLRYDELTTLLTQVEDILNSRPLSPLSEDPNDLQPLTPAHFLIGTPLNSFPEPSTLHLPINRLTRWQRFEQMRQQFWRRWKAEYLHTLQQRKKWLVKDSKDLKGKVVILKQEDTPVLTWPLGIIEEIHPGKDQIVRSITVRTNKGFYKRPITQICLFPIEET